MYEKYHELLFQTSLFHGLTAEELNAVFAWQHPVFRNYAKQDYLFHVGDRAHSIGIVLKGSVTVLQEDFWGNRNIVTRISPGNLFAEVYAVTREQRMGVSVMTDEGAEILYLDAHRLLCTSNEVLEMRLIRNLLATIADKNLTLNTKLSHLSQRSTREKLLSYLSEVSAAQGSAEIEIPYDRQQLADYLSVNRSALSKELSRLREEGLLRYQKNRFTLLE